jgi:hypothetical protein
MYCPKCGTKCEDTHSFCYKCGFRLPEIEEEPQILPEMPQYQAQEPLVEESVVEESAAEEPVVEEPVEEEPVEETVSEDPVAEAAVLEETAAAVVPAQEPAPQPEKAVTAPPKGRLWPAVLTLGIMMVLGLALFLLRPSLPADKPQIVEGTPWFSVQGGVLSFDESLYTGGSELVIPETINGETVRVIGEDCFLDCEMITAVTLPSTLKEIDDRAFSGCVNLRGIHIPAGVLRIGNSAFARCASLEAIRLPDSVEYVGDRAMFRCGALKHIFYDGEYENWKKLYNGSMPNDTWVYCEDGNYPYERD